MIPTRINWQDLCAEIMRRRKWNIKQLAGALGLKYHTAHAIVQGLNLEPTWRTGVVMYNAYVEATEGKQ